MKNLSPTRAKAFLTILERVCYLLAAGCVGAWVMGARPAKNGEVKTYHFKGEFCGVELWEYSARGDSVAIWADFVTNGPTVHVVVRTNTYDGYLQSR